MILGEDRISSALLVSISVVSGLLVIRLGRGSGTAIIRVKQRTHCKPTLSGDLMRGPILESAIFV